MPDRPDQATSLARLLGEIEELEKSRTALLRRVEQVRSNLLAAGDRTTAIRASVDLLCDHITDVVQAAAELSALEGEIQEAEQAVQEADRESAGLAFESHSLLETLDEADQEMERLSSLLVERKGRHSRGH